MQRGWIVEMISDLETFAKMNGMEVLGERLAEARNAAASETSPMPQSVLPDGCK